MPARKRPVRKGTTRNKNMFRELEAHLHQESGMREQNRAATSPRVPNPNLKEQAAIPRWSDEVNRRIKNFKGEEQVQKKKRH